jgi:hypothetical protein
VGGEHGGEACAFDIGAEFRQFDRAVFRVWADQAFGERLEGGVGCFGCSEADIGGEALGAAVEGVIAEGSDEGGDIGFGEVGFVHHAVDGEGDGEDGVSEGVLLGVGAGALGEVEERLGEAVI